LRGARSLLDRDNLPRLAYHLAVLALEEVGKARILKMKVVSERQDREFPAAIARAMDDHVRKLFWAIWGPSMGHELVTREQIEGNIGLAQRLHERRIGGLYVDRTAEGVSLPMGSIAADETDALLRFARTSIEIERVPPGAPEPERTPEEEERTRWFFDATDDAERRKLIFGGASMRKLHECADVRKWVTWLKETFETNEAESRAALDREMARVVDDRKTAQPKWRTTIRLYSASHSIRQKPLNNFNSGLHWVKFRAVSGKNNQLLVDLDAGSNLAITDVWQTSYFLSRRLVMALNVATLGHFWFHEPLDRDPKASGRFYERITDLQTKIDVGAHRNPPLRIEFGPPRALEDADLHRVVGCFAALISLHGPEEGAICDRYHDGTAFIAKTDSQMSFEIQGVAAFYIALKTAMSVFGYWQPSSESYPVALRRFCGESYKEFDLPHVDRLIDNGEVINTGRPVQHAMTMNDVGVMKAICDTYLIRTFRKLDDEWFSARQPKHSDGDPPDEEIENAGS
jgi:AbiV family abortive infection protein